MTRKSTVVEAEVVETCPGMRKDGTCGNGMSDNHNNPCRGCGCPDRKQYEPNLGRSSETAVAAQNRDGIVKTIARQIEAVRGAELRSTFEKLKLGAMVKQAVTLLGLDSKGGRGRVGDGVKGWWDENFKGEDGQPVIQYWTLMKWISAAEKLSEKMAVGGGKSEAIMCTLAKDPANVVGKEAKILKSAEKVANGMTMRQMLLWGDDEEARRPGRPKGSGAGAVEPRAKTAEVKAAEAEQEMRELIGRLGAYLTRGGKVGMLTAQARDDFHRALVDYAQQLAEMM